MKRVLIALLAMCAFGAFAATASATEVGLGDCNHYADNPSYGSGGVVEGHGSVTSCQQPTTIQLQVCLEKNTGGGWSGAYNCNTAGPTGGLSYMATYSYGQVAGCGTWFRTWSWGYVSYFNGIQNVSYSNSLVSDANYRC